MPLIPSTRLREVRRRGPALLTMLAALLLLAFTSTAVTSSTATAATPAGPGSAATGDDVTAAAGQQYYVLIAGSCDTTGAVFDHPGIDYRGGVKLKVAYPATAPGACGTLPYVDSVEAGHRNAVAVIEEAHRADPDGQFVVVGFSQGAQVANLLLEDIADGLTSVPPSQVDAKLYGDPMQPGTGIGALIPEGFAVPFGGYVSPGQGRTDLGEIDFLRYCIETDGVCDNRSPLESIGGYFAQHPCYAANVFWTISDGVYSNASHFWPRVNCAPPLPF